MNVSPSHLRDSALFGGIWAEPEVRDWFSEQTRTRTWLGMLGCTALAQSDIGAIPATAATRIAHACATAEPAMDEIAALTRASGHSTYGLLEWLQRAVGPEAAGYVALATTVQDITDLWTAYTMRLLGASMRRELDTIVTGLRAQARRYRSAPLLARTHGQPAVPMTLGWKLASWGIELERHQRRLLEGRERWEVAPIGGSVGTLAYWRSDAPRLMDAVAARTGLRPAIAPWGPARDNIAEFAAVCSLVTATLAKVGNEIYQLQRPEIGEVAERSTTAQVGSVTMPHKRNPERSEHLATLNTLTRASAEALMAAAAGEHERDGRCWKVEWVALPDVCCYACTAVTTAAGLLGSVAYDTAQMRRNVVSRADLVLSEQRMRSAHGQRRYRDAYRDERSAVRAGTDQSPSTPTPTELAHAIGSAEALVDRWLATDPVQDEAAAVPGRLAGDSGWDA